MSDLDDYTTEELAEELARRPDAPKPNYGACGTCRKWQAYVGVYDRDGYTLRCSGCVRAVGRCTCR